MSDDFEEVLHQIYNEVSRVFMDKIVAQVFERWGDSVSLFSNINRSAYLSLDAALYNNDRIITRFPLIEITTNWESNGHSKIVEIGGVFTLDPADPRFSTEFIIDQTMAFLEEQVLTNPKLKLQ